jgi:hypothetical protein
MPPPERGIYPLAGADQGMIMLTGMVTGLNGGSMVVTAAGQAFPLRLMPDTRVLKAASGALIDIGPGQLVNVRAVQQTNGTVTAATVHLMEPFSPQPPSASITGSVLAPSASPAPR